MAPLVECCVPDRVVVRAAAAAGCGFVGDVAVTSYFGTQSRFTSAQVMIFAVTAVLPTWQPEHVALAVGSSLVPSPAARWTEWQIPHLAVVAR